MRKILLFGLMGAAYFSIVPPINANEVDCSLFQTKSNQTLTLEQHADNLYKAIARELQGDVRVTPFRHSNYLVTSVRFETPNFITEYESFVDKNSQTLSPEIDIWIFFSAGRLRIINYPQLSGQKLVAFSIDLRVESTKCPIIGKYYGSGSSTYHDRNRIQRDFRYRTYEPNKTPEVDKLVQLVDQLASGIVGTEFPKGYLPERPKNPEWIR